MNWSILLHGKQLVLEECRDESLYLQKKKTWRGRGKEKKEDRNCRSSAEWHPGAMQHEKLQSKGLKTNGIKKNGGGRSLQRKGKEEKVSSGGGKSGAARRGKRIM